MLLAMHYFRARPAIGRPLYENDNDPELCTGYSWWTFGEMFRRTCLLVNVLRCTGDSSSEDSLDDTSGDEQSAHQIAPTEDEIAFAKSISDVRRQFAELLLPGEYVALISENVVCCCR